MRSRRSKRAAYLPFTRLTLGKKKHTLASSGKVLTQELNESERIFSCKRIGSVLFLQLSGQNRLAFRPAVIANGKSSTISDSDM